MIKVENVTKNFDSICAVNQVSLEIPEGSMFGLLGTNGAGKSTLLRMMAGVLPCDAGEIRFDGERIYENPGCKASVFYLPDVPYYFPNANMEEMARFYRRQYPAMERESAAYMAELLNLDMTMPLRTFSKGMKRQAFLILALCAGAKYLLCDEVFDGLDPVMTEAVKNLFRQEMKEREFTVVAAAHKLQDLEDVCHNIGIMHKGGILRAGDMRERLGNVVKLQCVFDKDIREGLEKDFEILKYERDGYFVTIVGRGDRREILDKIKSRSPVFAGEVPMSLEEVFMAEMEEAGYDIRKVFL
ncbi:MAG: ABC transporter ATP-binding protein [Lachnospiraceae bacterium]